MTVFKVSGFPHRRDTFPELFGAEWLAANLEGSHQSSDGFIACCPAHDDQNPSLSISEDETGKVLVHCHADCEQQEVIDALVELEIWPPKRAKVPLVSTKHRKQEANPDKGVQLSFAPASLDRPNFRKLLGQKPTAVYPYRDQQGRRLGYVCRLQSGTNAKTFRPITPWRNDNGVAGWRVAGFKTPKPLFGLPELGKRPSVPVLIVEGEKAARAAKALVSESVVVTWPGGAKSVAHVDWSPLSGRDVTVWPDADRPGIKAAEEIARLLAQVGAAQARIVNLPADLPAGWDLADELPSGIDVTALIAGAQVSRNKLAPYLLSASELAALNIPPREMIISPFLPANSLNLLYAPRGVGKTWVALTMGKAIATGTTFLGFAVPKKRRVLYIDGEMPLAELKKRLQEIGAVRTEMLDILSSELLYRESVFLNIHEESDQLRITEMLDEMERDGRRLELIILDNLSALRSGVDENDNTALDSLLRWLRGLRHRGYAILLVHHAGKSGDQRGASRLEDFLDTTIKLEPTEKRAEGASFELSFSKTRGETPQPSRLRLSLVKDKTGVVRWDFGEAIREEAHDQTLLAIHRGPKNDRSRFKKQLDIAKRLDVIKSTVSKHVSRLSASGLVEEGARGWNTTEAGVARLRLLFPNEEFD